jgi:hypothetical protein
MSFEPVHSARNTKTAQRFLPGASIRFVAYDRGKSVRRFCPLADDPVDLLFDVDERLFHDVASLANHAVENFRRARMGRWARRSAAFMPLQRGSRFDIWKRLVVRALKRAEARAPSAPQPFLNCTVGLGRGAWQSKPSPAQYTLGLSALRRLPKRLARNS